MEMFIYYLASLPMFMQGMLLAVGVALVASLTLAASVFIYKNYARSLLGDSRKTSSSQPAGATPRSEEEAPADEAEDLESCQAPIVFPGPALSEVEVERLEIPTILRRDASFNHQRSAPMQMARITEHLFGISPINPDMCLYKECDIGAMTSVLQEIGAAHLTSLGRRYNY